MARLADIDKLLEKQFFSLDDDGFGMMVVSVTDIISAPTVERKKGRWIPTYHTYYNRDGEHQIADEWHCSECEIYSRDEWHYCPNCGADMRGDGDG